MHSEKYNTNGNTWGIFKAVQPGAVQSKGHPTCCKICLQIECVSLFESSWLECLQPGELNLAGHLNAVVQSVAWQRGWTASVAACPVRKAKTS